jgi:hypothetical protein
MTSKTIKTYDHKYTGHNTTLHSSLQPLFKTSFTFFKTQQDMFKVNAQKCRGIHVKHCYFRVQFQPKMECADRFYKTTQHQF